MEILTLVVGMFETNCYLVYDRDKSEGVVIDPGDEAERIAGEIERLDFRPKMILLTHGHADHIGAVSEIQEKYDIPLCVGRGEEPLLKSAIENLSALVGRPITVSAPMRLLTDNDTVSFGSVALKILQTPGHSPGGICYYADGIVFCGDTIFSGSVGRTDFPGCSHEQLISSITKKLLVLPDETVCYPGHGPTTSIGDEKRQNPFLRGWEIA
jgi:hydroxyacylglutathione hydrolase